MDRGLSRYSALLTGVLSIVALSVIPGRLVTAQTVALLKRPSAADQDAFFESRIRPILSVKCLSCHGAQAKGGLRLDSSEAIARGGTGGAVIVAGIPDRSRLIAAVRYDGPLHMPPSGKLRPEEISSLEAWVKMGARWPDAVPVPSSGSGQAKDMKLTEVQKSFWSFQRVFKPALPTVKNQRWCLSPIDRFVLSKLESRGLKPAPAADRRALIRRVTFDLIGLPPTPEEVNAFINDPSPDAWQRLVDRLLASPHYGERWGRHWLDLVRYADSNGLDENVAFANAFRFRDYIVKSFNRDKPYNQFVCEQLAGDLMPAADAETRNDRLTATGFLSLGPKLLAEPDKPKMVMDIVDEQIEVTSKAFLGLTVTCARCHNHKFDPIPTKDYYALAGIFKSTKTMSNLNTVAMWDERPLQPEGKNGAASPSVMAVEDGTAVNCKVHIRGDTQNLGDEVPRHFLTVLGGDKDVIDDSKRSGRLELAQWITRPDNPLAGRVEVNRIWQGHFGAGLVQTPDNWGFLGLRPSNPELLDWLAATFVERGWSIKAMHRLILNSKTYKMGTVPDARTAAVAERSDPDNTLLWKMPHRRLEAEPFRDALLFVSGKLDLSIGGTLLTTHNHDYVTNDQSGNAATYNTPRRSLYLPIIRNALFDMFQAFDYGDPSMVNARRSTTTVAPQALYVMNSPFVIEQARSFALSLLENVKGTDDARIESAYLRAYGRPPSSAEIRRDIAYLQSYEARVPAGTQPSKRAELAWTSFCQLLFASNEFIYVD